MTAKFRLVSTGNPTVANLRCPACRHNGAFNTVVPDPAFVRPTNAAVTLIYGVRFCPNPECGEPVFVVLENGKLVKTYPPEYLDFDPSGIPAPITASFIEAITDHANSCFKSAAIMVRRTLEEICADRNAQGNDLKARLTALRSSVLLPKELLDAADELRLLGNDAAHLEAKVYDEVGKAEVEAAIDLCKEILKAVYQLASLVARLRSLKKTP